ncbi:hypothetical protein ACIBEJ_05710 [Nonomuraea sp. NPDC050790]|uniref:hypothetical protein n=1 Tax=Nonomuraea sp. NPDC050790 TaxID=3364371 RepID=UPI0037874606
MYIIEQTRMISSGAAQAATAANPRNFREHRTHDLAPRGNTLAMSTTALIALTGVVTAGAIWLIVLAARLTRRPRNRPAPSADLVDQALEMKALGQIQEAVFLVRGETGMSHRAASRFVRRL